ncbi:uncharacterized protein BDR25DRAFT_353224 [Lindgomyces ingoldianus]|uniref:Uncharacterized protein n=1 Tax=Lindgomyces ingoldianus TaxID=673940 RepID=A0ACB6R395_9PLEO|nr:uncharacterized protein BDR25DRAFT_353224 [Lindgomyces ingoldianus]KAF2472911.1 hypothetical protein BDR25DRAFT_353224 [Lindgomyces ingoldianus]
MRALDKQWSLANRASAFWPTCCRDTRSGPVNLYLILANSSPPSNNYLALHLRITCPPFKTYLAERVRAFRTNPFAAFTPPCFQHLSILPAATSLKHTAVCSTLAPSTSPWPSVCHSTATAPTATNLRLTPSSRLSLSSANCAPSILLVRAASFDSCFTSLSLHPYSKASPGYGINTGIKTLSRQIMLYRYLACGYLSTSTSFYSTSTLRSSVHVRTNGKSTEALVHKALSSSHIRATSLSFNELLFSRTQSQPSLISSLHLPLSNNIILFISKAPNSCFLFNGQPCGAARPHSPQR